MKGHFIPHTEETKRKISLKKLGISTSKKGKKFPQYSGENSFFWKGGRPHCKVCNIEINRGAKTCLKHRNMKDISKKRNETIIKNGGYKPSWNKGNKGYKAGSQHYNWKGGITPINNKIRGSLEYKLWSDSVLNKDNNECKKCHKGDVNKLVAHHIKNFSDYVELRFAIDNGVTFCRKCHNWFHRKYGIKNNTQEQLNEFLKS